MKPAIVKTAYLFLRPIKQLISAVSKGCIFPDYYFTLLNQNTKEMTNAELWDYLVNHYHKMHRKAPDLEYIFFLEKSIDKNMTILEFGCSTGMNLAELSRRGFKNLTGVDISSKSISYGKKANHKFNINFIQADFAKNDILQELQSKYDIIFTRAVLQHIPMQEVLQIINKFISLQPLKMIFMECDNSEMPFGRIQGHRVWNTFNHDWIEIGKSLNLHHTKIALAKGIVQLYTLET
jgi:SAM-dependent methyltransferase